jgi:hypothetical protein
MFDLDRLERAEQALRRMSSGEQPPVPPPVQRAEPPRQCPFQHGERRDQAA